MIEKLEILLQIQNQSSDASIGVVVVVITAIVVIAIVLWQAAVGREYQAAKDDFRRDPTDRANRQRLIEAAKSLNDEGKSALEVVALFDSQYDREVKSQNPKSKFVAELKSLSDMHERGALTDEEFEQAKAKLLS